MNKVRKPVHYRVPLEEPDLRVARKFFDTVRNYIGCRVSVQTKQGQSFSGVFVAFEPIHLSILLRLDNGQHIMIRGDSVASMLFEEPRFDKLEDLRNVISKSLQTSEVAEIYPGIGKVVVKFQDESKLHVFRSGDMYAVGNIAQRYLTLLKKVLG